MKITRRQLRQIIREELLREGDDPPFEDDWFNQNWSKLKSKIESELVGPYGTGAGMEPDLIQEEDLEPIWKSIFGTQFPDELDMIEAELDDKILSMQGGKQESGYTLRQLEKIIKDLDSKFYFVPAEPDRETKKTKSKGHFTKGTAGPDAIPSGKGRKDALRRAEIIKSLRENKMKLTRGQLRQIIKEELNLLEVDSDGDGKLDPDELRHIASELEGNKPLVKRGGRHDRVSGYTYDNVTGVHVRNDYNPRTDYDNTLDKVLTQMGARY